jgi:SMODS-associating 2TM, beta-strand rich effector domain
MISGILIRAIVVIVSIVFVAGSWITTGAPNTSLLSFFSIAVLVCTILLLAWDRWIWKWTISQAIPGVSRDLSGTWQAQLKSFWIDPTTGKSPAPKTVYMVIRQTSSTASVTLISDESKSKSSLARVVKEDGSWLLHYVYTNEPRLGRVDQEGAGWPAAASCAGEWACEDPGAAYRGLPELAGGGRSSTAGARLDRTGRCSGGVRVDPHRG